MSPFCAAVDWGTSSFRLWLLSQDGTVLGTRRSDEGMTAAISAGFDSILERYLAALDAATSLPVVICGMAGARQGWREAAYLDTPADLASIADGAVAVEAAGRDVRILPGVAQRDPQWPDVIRGEETQLLGLLAQDIRSGLVCLPGTHSKWAVLEDGRLTRFATLMTGDLFSAIASHSILRLAIGANSAVAPDDPAFVAAAVRALGEPREAMARLFAIRAGPLLGLADEKDAAALLSGTLIGLELAGARSRFGDQADIVLVASGDLGTLYRAAFEATGANVRTVDGETAVRAGLSIAARAIWGGMS